MKEKSRFASFLFHLGLTSLFGQALRDSLPVSSENLPCFVATRQGGNRKWRIREGHNRTRRNEHGGCTPPVCRLQPGNPFGHAAKLVVRQNETDRRSIRVALASRQCYRRTLARRQCHPTCQVCFGGPLELGDQNQPVSLQASGTLAEK